MVSLVFLGGSVIKKLPTVQEAQVTSLGQEDLEKEMETYSSILAWEILWTEEPGGLVYGVKKSRTRLSD